MRRYENSHSNHRYWKFSCHVGDSVFLLQTYAVRKTRLSFSSPAEEMKYESYTKSLLWKKLAHNRTANEIERGPIGRIMAPPSWRTQAQVHPKELVDKAAAKIWSRQQGLKISTKIVPGSASRVIVDTENATTSISSCSARKDVANGNVCYPPR